MVWSCPSGASVCAPRVLGGEVRDGGRTDTGCQAPSSNRVHAPPAPQELARLEIPAELAVMLRKEEGESCLPGVTLPGTPPQPLIV